MLQDLLQIDAFQRHIDRTPLAVDILSRFATLQDGKQD